MISDHDIFAPFLNVVHSFGVKADVDENVWDGFYAALSPESSKDGGKDGCPEKVELCYNIRYVEKHGRQQSCRWSLRQFGIYQSFNPATRHQILIFIQPPDSIYQYLKRHINTPEATDDRGIGLHPISIHAANLSRALNNWDEYIEDLRSELMQLDDKACFSKMGVADKLHDYTITFGDKQKLQLLRHKFLRTLSVLDSTLEVANALMSQFSKFEHPGSQLRDITLAREELNACCSQIRRLRRNASLLLEISTRTDDLLSKILDLRNDRVQCRTSETMLGTLDTLKQIATQSSVAVEQSRKDSKMLKSLTLTMTMYIPATLLATIFSSNLIQLTPDGSGDGKTARFHVVSQFWLYLILTVFLTAVTLVPENKRLRGLTLGSSYIYLGLVYAIGYRKTERNARLRHVLQPDAGLATADKRGVSALPGSTTTSLHYHHNVGNRDIGGLPSTGNSKYGKRRP